MEKYAPLKDYLLKSKKKTEILSFSQIEQIIGAELPPSAHKHSAWWSNGMSKPLIETLAWVEAGWKVVNKNFTKKEITFEKIKNIQENTK